MVAGSDFSLQVGVRVKDDATPALQQIGRTASSTGRQVESSMRGASQQLGSLGQSASRSTAGVQSAARQWEASARRGGESAGRAAGDGLSRGVTSGARQAGDRAGGELATGMRGRVRGLGGDIRGELMGPLMAGVAGAGIVSFFQGAIDKASDLNETVSKSKSIFGEQQAAMQQWSQGAAQAMGLSSQKALDAATSFGDMFRQLGDSAPVAAQTSQQVVQLAADLGSFNNLETGDVIERLSAAFRGEYDSLQAVIPNISAARVEQEAMAESGKTSASALTQQEKAHATLAIVMKDGARAQGDFAKTADGAANTAKRNAAAFEDLQAKVGQGLLSAFQALQGAMGGLISGASVLVDGIAKIAHVFSELPGPIQMAIGTFGALRLAQALLGDRMSATSGKIKSFVGSIREMGSANDAVVRTASGVEKSMGRFGSAVSGIGNHVPVVQRMQHAFVDAAAGAERFPRSAGLASAGMTGLKGAAGGLMGAIGGPFGLAIAGAGMGLSLLAQHHQKTAQAAAEQKSREAELAGTLDKTTGAVTAATRSTAAKQLEDEGLLKTASELHLSLSDVTDAYLGQPGALGKVNSALDAANEKYKTQNSYTDLNGVVHERSSKKITGFKDKLNDSAGAASRAAEANKRVADATKKTDGANQGAAKSADQVAQSEEERAQALKETIDSYKQLNSTLLQQRNDSRGYQAAIDAVTDSIKKNGRTLDEGTEAGRANGDTLDQLAQKAGAYASSQFALHQNAAEANAILQDGKQRYIEAAVAMNMPREQAEKLANELIQVRDASGKPIDIKSTSSGLDAVHDKLSSTGKLVATLQGSKIEIPADTPNAPQVLQMLEAIKGTAYDASQQKLTVTAEAMKVPETKAAIDSIPGVVHNKDGSVTIDVKQLGADVANRAIGELSNVARLANGQIVHIPASTNAAQIKAIVDGLHADAVTFNGTQMVIKTSAPMAPSDQKKLKDLAGTAIKFNGTTMTVDTKALTADSLRKLAQLMDAAQNKDVWITTHLKTIREGNQRQADAKHRDMDQNAVGGIYEHGVKRFARGGVEDHEPQIAVPTPGRVRVWAEPETQGEAYIPFANDGRRTRAKSITEYVARKFGGSVTWHADGSADDWTPDMSGIMAYANSLKVDPSALTEQRKKVADQNSALNKAIRDLKAARAGLKGKSGAARVKAENAVATAIERQAKAQRDLNDGKAKLNQMSAGASADTTTRFMLGTTSQNGLSKRFLDNIERIRKRGFPRLARSLLEQGDSDAQAIAQTLSGGALSRLKDADKGLETSDKLADRKSKLLDDLKGISGSGLTATAQQQANAQLIALQAANQRQALTGGVVKVQMPTAQQIAAEMVGKVQVHLPEQIVVQSHIDGAMAGRSVSKWQDTQASSGSVMPGLKI